MLSSHLFLCLPCLLPPFTVPCNMVLARPDERETCPQHCDCVSLRWSGGLRGVQLPAGFWHGLPCWKHGLRTRCVVSCGSTSFPWLVFCFGALLFMLAPGRALCAILDLIQFTLAPGRPLCAIIDRIQFYTRPCQSIVCHYRSYSVLSTHLTEHCVPL